LPYCSLCHDAIAFTVTEVVVLWVVHLHEVLTGVVEYARVGYSDEQVVQRDHNVVVDSQTDEQKRCRRENLIAHRPEHNCRHHVA